MLFFADFQSFCQRFKFTKIIAKVDCEALGLEIRWTIEQQNVPHGGWTAFLNQKYF